MAEFNPNDYNGEQLVIVSIFFLALTFVSVGLRVFVRIWIMKSFQWDDWLMLIAQGVFALSCSFILRGVHYGMGHHDDSLPVPERIQGLKYQALATLTYVANMMFIKLSIAIFLLRIATKKRYTWTLKISMVIVTIWSLAIFFFDIFQCTPVQAQWDFTIQNSKCASGDSFVAAAYSISVLTVITDWMYAIIPIPMIWSVQMSTQKKITVAFVLSLGIFASIATLIRVKYLVELSDYSDILFTGTTAMVWTLIEPGIAITAASLITIRPLLRALNFAGFNSTGQNSSRNLTSNNNMTRSMGQQNISQRRDDFALANWNALSSVTGPEEAVMKGAGKGESRMRSEPVSDAESEQYILQGGGTGSLEGGIKRTRTVTVVSDRQSRSGSRSRR
ncbi:hypothetical protein N431DRAFT_381270 [Stipitochalara longipes BDJ]|nr:hypothetical protein N431DRAFT_381270 [Stipitochalara longipes BDJ]